MRTTAMCLVFATAASAGCLRNTEFKCVADTQCGPMEVCEAVGYCSVLNSHCPDTGRSFSDSAGQGLSNACVPGNSNPGLDAGTGADAAIDGPPPAGCPSPYAQVNGSTHLYKRLLNTSWDIAAADCKLTSASAYLAVPDNATELTDLAAAAAGLPFWVGIDDLAIKGTFVTQKNAPATFLPWAAGEPNQTNPPKECVNAISATQIATEKCSTTHTAVCECEP